MNDEQCLSKFLEMLSTRVGITTAFVHDGDGNITHQVLQISCGDFMSVSDPQPLKTILRFATAEELNETIH